MYYTKNLEAYCAVDINGSKRWRLGVQHTLHQWRHNPPNADNPTGSSIELLPTSTKGEYSLRYNGIALHSVESPELEAKALCHQLITQTRPQQVHLVLGLGLGYLVAQLADISDGKIIIFAPQEDLLYWTLENVDLSAYLSRPNLYLVTQEQDLLETLRHVVIDTSQMDLLATPGCASLFGDTLQPLLDKIYNTLYDRTIDVQSAHQFHDQWLAQTLENSRHFHRCNFLDPLENYAAGESAIIVSRGPSLEEALEALKTMAHKAHIIAVGGALPHLIAHDIIPDFVLFADANGLGEQIRNLPEPIKEHTQFVLTPFVDPVCFEPDIANRLLFLPQGHQALCQWIAQVEEKPLAMLDGGVNVSVMGVNLARWMGCTTLILVGQDLAFRNETQVYAGGEYLLDDGTLSSRPHEAYATETQITTVAGQNGTTLRTLKTYIPALHQLCEIGQQNQNEHPPLALYNASIGGADISGWSPTPLENIPLLPLSKAQFPKGNRTKVPSGLSRQAKYHSAYQKLQYAIEDLSTESQRLLLEKNNLHSGSPQTFHQTIYPKFQQWIQQVKKTPLLYFTLQPNIFSFNQTFISHPTHNDEWDSNIKAMLTLLEEGTTGLQHRILHHLPKEIYSPPQFMFAEFDLFNSAKV